MAMFSIFKPKKTILSLFQGGIDLHNHLLPGIDDGAKTIDDTLALLAKYDEHQIHSIIATPHIMAEHYPNTPMIIENALAQVQQVLGASGFGHMQVTAGAEYMIDGEFEQRLETQELLTLTKNYVLIELSYASPPIHLFEDLYKLIRKGYIPILAHPERYLYYQNDNSTYKKLKAQGCLFQLNALSLNSFYGKEVSKNALQLLEMGMIDLIATDTHNLVQMKALETSTITHKMYENLKTISKQTQELFK